MKAKYLIGIGLDKYVAKALGVEQGAAYSTDWLHGGPIIEREKIEILYFGSYGNEGEPWEAQGGGDSHYIDQYPGDAISGPTPLVAAMRYYVSSKFGEESDL